MAVTKNAVTFTKPAVPKPTKYISDLAVGQFGVIGGRVVQRITNFSNSDGYGIYPQVAYLDTGATLCSALSIQLDEVLPVGTTFTVVSESRP